MTPSAALGLPAQKAPPGRFRITDRETEEMKPRNPRSEGFQGNVPKALPAAGAEKMVRFSVILAGRKVEPSGVGPAGGLGARA